MKIESILCEGARKESHRNFTELVNYFNSSNLKPEEMLRELDKQIQYWIHRKRNYEYELVSLRRGRPNLKNKDTARRRRIQLLLANCQKFTNTINKMMALKKRIYQHIYYT